MTAMPLQENSATKMTALDYRISNPFCRIDGEDGVIAEDVRNPTLSCLEERREPAAESEVEIHRGPRRVPLPGRNLHK